MKMRRSLFLGKTERKGRKYFPQEKDDLLSQGVLILDGRDELSSSDALDFAANKDRFLS